MAKPTLRQELSRLAKVSCGGSHLTKEARIRTVREFSGYLRTNNIQIKHVEQIRTKHIQGYAQSLQGKVSTRTLANRLSHIRAVVAAVGKSAMLKEDALTNKALGASGGCRVGTNRAIPDAVYVQIHAKVSTHSIAAGHVMELQRALGLRINEAVKGANKDTLQQWQKQLQHGYAEITKGTKGGREREATLVAGYERALTAVRNALEAATANGGYVITAPNGKKAYDAIRNVYAAVGLTKAASGYTSHSLRYAWAQEQLAAYKAAGMSAKGALRELSQDLGHGDGRGRYVAMVYCRKNG